jgi:hypothetical protein
VPICQLGLVEYLIHVYSKRPTTWTTTDDENTYSSRIGGALSIGKPLCVTPIVFIPSNFAAIHSVHRDRVAAGMDIILLKN